MKQNSCAALIVAIHSAMIFIYMENSNGNTNVPTVKNNSGRLISKEGLMMQELPDIFPEEEDWDEEWYEEDDDEPDAKKERERETTCQQSR